jgi:hypothetical protein
MIDYIRHQKLKRELSVTEQYLRTLACREESSEDSKTSLLLRFDAPLSPIEREIERAESILKWEARASELRNEIYQIDILITNFRNECAAKANEDCRTVFEMLTSYLIIDSNIWMNEEYDMIFDWISVVAKRENLTLRMLSSQFDEICNIKNKKTSPDGAKEASARLAIKRIYRCRDRGILKIEKIGINPDRKAYADPKILDALVSADQPKKVIVTDDIELAIRATELLSGSCTHYSGLDLLHTCESLNIAHENRVFKCLGIVCNLEGCCTPC